MYQLLVFILSSCLIQTLLSGYMALWVVWLLVLLIPSLWLPGLQLCGCLLGGVVLVLVTLAECRWYQDTTNKVFLHFLLIALSSILFYIIHIHIYLYLLFIIQ